MNIAFPALIVLLLLLPGVLLSYSYRRGFFQRSPVTLGPIRDEIGRGIVLALFIHPIALFVAWGLMGWSLNAGVLASVFAEIGEVDPARASRQVVGGLWYLVGTNAGALAIGGLAHWIVRANHLDLRWDHLRFNNEWHYLLSGEARVFKVEQKERTISTIKRFLESDFEFVFVSVVVTVGDHPILYWGVLSDYFFDASGQLDKIVLEDAQRRPLHSDIDQDRPVERPAAGDAANMVEMPTESERFYSIRGAYLVIRYADVQTLNVEYMTLADEE